MELPNALPTPESAVDASLPPGVEKILFTSAEIRSRIAALGTQISQHYRGRDLKLIGVLKGSVFFLTELARAISIPVKMDFLAISSFSNQRGAPGMVRIAKDLDDSVEDEDLLLVEDIVDTGFTSRYLLHNLAARGPNSLKICTLLDRTSKRLIPLTVDFRCFEIPDRFVIGYGLDYKQLYRNLDYIAVLNPDKAAV